MAEQRVASNAIDSSVASPDSSNQTESDQRRRRKQLIYSRAAAWLYPLAGFALIIGAWEVAVRLLQIPTYLLPAPSVIADSIQANAGLLIKHSLITASEIALGFALSVVVGIPLALGIYIWNPFSRVV